MNNLTAFRNGVYEYRDSDLGVVHSEHHQELLPLIIQDILSTVDTAELRDLLVRYLEVFDGELPRRRSPYLWTEDYG
jgi:hypothetical protein